MKKVQDYYFKKAKKENYPARSVYKLIEAQEKYHFIKKGDKIADLGCHPGSWSMYASKVVGPQGLVVGIDLQAGKRAQLSGRAAAEVICGDIFSQEAIEALLQYSKQYQVVLCDMAPRTTGNKWADQQKSLELSRRAFEIAEQVMPAGGCFYCKVFEGEDFKEYYDSVRKHFKKAKIVKPKSSRKESREVFVMGIGYIK